ncbi:MAG: exodeoxyribonuclease VII small subunit [Chloroflexi bacterium]|nr:MAG: exodeoxyribonuclease VII small subunit [Chloroflexota bacterium]
MSATPDDGSAVESQQPSYEQARDELIQIVAQLETGGTTLEQSLTLWQRGEDLANLCERYLDAARVRLDNATAPGGGRSPPQ